MNSDTGVIQTQELVFRRLSEDFSQLVLLMPVAFAFVVVFMILFYRQSESMSGLLKTLFIPPPVITVLSIVWSAWLLIYAIGGFIVAMTVPDVPTVYYLIGLLPLVAYPVLLGLLATLVMCIRNPACLVPLLTVGVVCGIYLIFAAVFKPTIGWWVVLGPALFVALVYVALMYRQDAQSVHPVWAGFLGLLRCCVYAILAFIFLMPGCQAFDTKVTHSKVLVLIDKSASMKRIDALPKPGEANKKMPTRLDEVTAALQKTKFVDAVKGVSPVSLFAFGARLDDFNTKEFKADDVVNNSAIEAWLMEDVTRETIDKMVGGQKLDKEEKEKLQEKLIHLYDGFSSGTNVSGAALQALLKEAGSNVQAIIILSDGQSNLSSSDSLYELVTRANNPKKTTHIFTVCVGKYIQPKSINIGDIQAPVQARPDDKFYVQVPVYGDGLANKPFEVQLDIEQVVKNGDKWEPKPGGLKTTLTEKGTFKPVGKSAFDQVKYEIDVRKLKGIDPKDDTKDDSIKGFWQFTARVARDPDEHFDKGEHVSKPTQVVVDKKKYRVLLFAGGPSREYQFVRTLLYREVQESRLELSVFLQTGLEEHVDQDVETERLLTTFPNTLGKENLSDKQKYYDLSSYDVVIAMDPDWTSLSNTQLENLNKWVSETWAGGFIFVAGPINTYQLARDEKSLGKNLTPIKQLLPVTLKDSRLAGFSIDLDPTRPYTLKWETVAHAPQYEFLKLDEADKALEDTWDYFFWEDSKPAPGKLAKPVNGFYSYYPVKEKNPGGEVLATFVRPGGDPLINDDNLKEQPFIAVQKIGNGHSLYLGSGEFWRLRQLDEEYHKTFWIKSVRFAGTGTQNQINQHGNFVMAHNAPVGVVPVEVQLMKKSKVPFAPDTPFKVTATLVEGEKDAKKELKPFDLKPRPDGTWTGWFQGAFQIQQPGRYRLSVSIPGSNQDVEHVISIFKPDPEKDNPRPNHDYLYELASSAQPIFKLLGKEDEEALRTALKANKLVSEEKRAQLTGEGKDEARLCFDLSNLDLIAKCLVQVPPTEESIKGGLSYFLDRGFNSQYQWRGDELLIGGTLIIGGVILALLLLTRRWIGALIMAVLGGVIILGVLLMNVAFAPTWETFQVDFAFVLLAIVGLLCLEWLTRKLLRLA